MYSRTCAEEAVTGELEPSIAMRRLRKTAGEKHLPSKKICFGWLGEVKTDFKFAF